MTQSLKIILDDFADFHDLRRIRRDAHGIYTLVFDQHWVVNIESDPLSGTVSIFGSAGSARAELDRPATMPEIEWHPIPETDLPFGGRIGVHFRSGVLLLDSTTDPAHLDTVAFRHWLLAFVAQMALWASRISLRNGGSRLADELQRGGRRSGDHSTTPPDFGCSTVRSFVR